MVDIQLAWPEAIILLGVVAILVAAIVVATLTEDDRTAAPPKDLLRSRIWENFRYPVRLRRHPGGFGPQLPGVKPNGRFYSLWGLYLSCTQDYNSRFTGALQRIRR